MPATPSTPHFLMRAAHARSWTSTSPLDALPRCRSWCFSTVAAGRAVNALSTASPLRRWPNAACWWAERGLLVVVPDYRLYPDVTYPGFLEDAARAVGWTFQHIAQYGGDPHQVYLMGHSAGAYNAAMLAYDRRWLVAEHLAPEQLAGFMGLAGPYHFLPIQDLDVQPVFHWPDTPPDTQPIMHVTSTAPRTLLITAEQDVVVNPARNSGALADALRRAGVPVELRRYSALNHATALGALAWPLRGLAPVLDEITTFVAQATPDHASPREVVCADQNPGLQLSYRDSTR